MNVAAGSASDGNLIVLAAGQSGRPPAPDPLPILYHDRSNPLFDRRRNRSDMRALDSWICRSSDGGETRTRDGEVTIPDGEEYFIPFGDIISADGQLWASFYDAHAAWIVRSSDDGRSWPGSSSGTGLFRSTDGGQKWKFELMLTTARQIPGHLLCLEDGRILFCFGLRNTGLHGVAAGVPSRGSARDSAIATRARRSDS